MSVDWKDVLVAKDVSMSLNRNEKFVYLLWRNNSELLLENSVALRGTTLLITRAGYEHLKKITEKEDEEKAKREKLEAERKERRRKREKQKKQQLEFESIK